MMKFVRESLISASPERVFAFHELPDVFERLMPPWEKSRIIQSAPDLQPGATAIIETRILGLITVRWVARHTLYEPPRMFEDVQVKGPFQSWRHRHLIEPHAEGALLRDEIEYEPPLGFVGRMAAPLLIEPRLRRLFEYRHRITREWCEGGEAISNAKTHRLAGKKRWQVAQSNSGGGGGSKSAAGSE